MNNNNVILLVEAQVRPESRKEAVALARVQLVPTLEEAGCIALFQTEREDDPGRWVFFEVFVSEEAHDFHLAQSYTRAFFAAIKDKLTATPTITRLRSLGN